MSAQPEELDELDRQLVMLCAGYDRPFTTERREAYRKGLAKMHPAMLERVVEHCLGEDAPEKFPTCRQLWQISAKLRARRAPGATADAGPRMSRWAILANQVLLVMAYGDGRGASLRPIAEYPPMPKGGYGLPLKLVQPTDRSRLDAVLALKAEIVGYAEEAAKAGEPWTAEEFVDVLRVGFEKLLQVPREEAA